LAAQDLPLALAELETLPGPLQASAWRGLAKLAAEPKHRDQGLATLSALPPGDVRGKSLGVSLREWTREANPT
jgi:hypothetical protein